MGSWKEYERKKLLVTTFVFRLFSLVWGYINIKMPPHILAGGSKLK